MDEASFEIEKGNVLLDVIAANHIQNDVDPSAIGQFLDGLDEIFVLVIDRPFGAEVFAGLAFFLGTGGGENAGAKFLCHLNCRGPDSGGATMDEKSFSVP